MFLAYNANNGLPFVPTRELKVELAGGANLVKGNEVREGGYRVGVVEDIEPVMLRSGDVGAQLKLKLDKTVGDVPGRLDDQDPPALGARPQVPRDHEGQLEADVPQRGHAAVSHSTVPVELDEIYNTFDHEDAGRRRRQTLQGSATRSRGAGSRSTRRSGGCRGCSATSRR